MSRLDDEGYDTVLFRHGDCAVLGSMLCVMNSAQRSAFFGTTMGIAFGGRKWGQVSLIRPRG
ncbi:MAG: hypothetical protein HC834_07800 [Rhodospirillales bacterium]|nr:hypothetical protein [Rhodospirillales bacterium]